MFDFIKTFKPKLSIYPDELHTVLSYQERLERAAEPAVDSSAGPARQCRLVVSYCGDRITFRNLEIA